ncbi:DUF7011 domain-containing protein [Cupriavidus necator]|uniref:DUF7011 domain-containing protein n=1 Tax=Cupriavidus necator TaxID=106590 RepID=UPI003AF3583D
MTTRPSSPQFRAAAYLYVLHLDQPALAWEYLRRHPDYRDDRSYRHQGMGSLHRWGLRKFEDPRLDARDAHPVWFPDHDSVLHLYPDADPAPDVRVFDFWKLSGEKHLLHDGRRLMLPGAIAELHCASDAGAGVGRWYGVRPRRQVPKPGGIRCLSDGGRDGIVHVCRCGRGKSRGSAPTATEPDHARPHANAAGLGRRPDRRVLSGDR